MDITLQPGLLSGQLTAPASKSCAHRALICAALSPTPTRIFCRDPGRDVQATAACLRALGAIITENPQGFEVEPISHIPEKAELFCRESGSTLRFLLPLVGALGVEATFYMEGRLPQRPLSPLWEEMERMGCSLSRPTANTILCRGQLRSGIYRIAASDSSQFISGLLMAFSRLPGSSLEVDGAQVSRPYIDLTNDILSRFPTAEFSVEGDWSNAAFFLAANALGSQVQVTDLDLNSVQGDRKIMQILQNMDENLTLSARDIPDLVPILAVVAACKQGATFTDTDRLRLKESDRMESVTQLLTALGGTWKLGENSMTVYPSDLKGGIVDSKHDHRIAMAAAIAATVCTGPVTILDAQCVQKSYPGFWDDFVKLGGML